MNGRRLLIAVAIVVASVVATLWFRAHREPPTSATSVRDPITASSPPTPATPAREVREKLASAEADGSAFSPKLEPVAPTPSNGEPDRDHDLHGRVVGPRGEPIADATIEVLRSIRREYRMLEMVFFKEPEAIARTTSNEAGEFRAHVPRGRPYDVRVTAAGFATEWAADRYAGEFVRIELHVGAVVFGRVTRAPGGDPVAGARLQLFRSEARGQTFESASDATGAFRFDRIPPGSYVLITSSEGNGSAPRLRFEVKEGVVVEKHVLVTAGITVSGKVTDAASGKPIAGAVVGQGWAFDKTAQTDADGEYVLSGFAPEGVYQIAARAAGFGQTEHEVRAKEGDRVAVDFALSSSHRAKGRVVGAGGEPISGAYVAAVGDARDRGRQTKIDWVSAKTGDDGVFDLRDLRGDVRHALIVMKDDLGRVVYDFPASETTEAVVDFGDVVLSAAGEIGGSVVDETGAGLPGAPVNLTGANADRSRFSNSPEQFGSIYASDRAGRTDDLGRFRFADLAAGEYTLSAAISARSDVVRESVTIGDGEVREGVRLVLATGLVVEGRVTDSRGVGLGMIFVSLEPEDETTSPKFANATTGSDGSFRFTSVDPGRYSLVAHPLARNASASDERFAQTRRAGVEAGARDVVIAMRRAAPIEGQAVRADGAPALDVLVSAIDADSDHVAQKITGADGRFVLDVAEGSVVTVNVRSRSNVDVSPVGPPGSWRQEPDATAPNVKAGTRDLVLRLTERH
ncbi:MAG: carboxypeptidase regulatory-like domain-containing protein [Planctomycetes bacterium]|nr:carboxypeptidase regulatory-like domain-containing protein [Planctomycetota bacterium]MBI3844181.1 carboxypeptidase regulatory-like domain-containing protein [Planctomycetota bacterium]